MIKIKRLRPRKVDDGILLDTNVFLCAVDPPKPRARNKKIALKILEAVEKNHISPEPDYAFYSTYNVAGELKSIDSMPSDIAHIVKNCITYIPVKKIDTIIAQISNGASKTDKGLLQVLATDPRVKILVSNDRHIWDHDIRQLIGNSYKKVVGIYNQGFFVKRYLEPKVNHSGLEEAEAYLRDNGILSVEEEE